MRSADSGKRTSSGVLLNAADLNSPDYYYYYEYSGKYGNRYYQRDEDSVIAEEESPLPEVDSNSA